MMLDTSHLTMSPAKRAAWAGAFLLLGCVLPFAVQQWVWSPVEVRVTNVSREHALEGLVLSAGKQRVVLERLAAGEQRLLRFHARHGALHLDVQRPGEAQPQRVSVKACCHAQVQLNVDGAPAPAQLSQPEGLWAELGLP